MSNLSSFLGGGSGGKMRYQEFTSSGTFTPSAKLLENGGQVMLDLRGGGGGSAVATPTSAGGSSKHIAPYTVTGATSVVIGAGGVALGHPTFAGGQGGTSSFGTLSIPGGAGGVGNSYAGTVFGGKGSGNEGRAGNSKFNGSNTSWNGPEAVTYATDTVTDNSGVGGSNGEPGKAGYCLVVWYE